MIWLAAALLALLAVLALRALIAWGERMVRDTDDFLERLAGGLCTCTRHRLCAACLAEATSERKEKAA